MVYRHGVTGNYDRKHLVEPDEFLKPALGIIAPRGDCSRTT